MGTTTPMGNAYGAECGAVLGDEGAGAYPSAGMGAGRF